MKKNMELSIDELFINSTNSEEKDSNNPLFFGSIFANRDYNVDGVNSALDVLNNLPEVILGVDPNLVNLEEANDIFNKAFKELLKDKKSKHKNRSIYFFPHIKQVLSEVAEQTEDYVSAIGYRRDKVVFEERLYGRTEKPYQKFHTLVDAGQDYNKISSLLHKSHINNTPFHMMAFVSFQDAFKFYDQLEFKIPRAKSLESTFIKSSKYTLMRLHEHEDELYEDYSEFISKIIKDKEIEQLRIPQVKKVDELQISEMQSSVDYYYHLHNSTLKAR